MRGFKPIKIADANKFISQYHRHSAPLRLGGEIAIGLYEDNELIGVGILGRPVARHLCDGLTIEIRRTCVKEGFKNANSQMYARLRRIAESIGYKKVITYTLQKENQSSLKAIGATIDCPEIEVQSWKKKRGRKHRAIYDEKKIRWIIN